MQNGGEHRDLAVGVDDISRGDCGSGASRGTAVQTGERIVTLIEAVDIAFTSNKRSVDYMLTQQLCSFLHTQLYQRWRKFCEGRLDAVDVVDPSTLRTGMGLPLLVAREFIVANIEWAKGRVLARLSRLLWARNSLLAGTPGSSVQGEAGDEDDEYDATAE